MFARIIDDTLLLRSLREDDTEQLFQVVEANREHLRVWLPWLDEMKDEDSQRGFIRSVMAQEERGQGFVCGILLEEEIVGVAGYHPIRWANKSVEIGYWLSREAVGRGIMTRCVRVLVDYAFLELGLNRVAIPAAEGNTRSRAIPERLGFKQEGILRDAEWLYDRYVDHVVYAALAREWSSAMGRCG